MKIRKPRTGTISSQPGRSNIYIPAICATRSLPHVDASMMSSIEGSSTDVNSWSARSITTGISVNFMCSVQECLDGHLVRAVEDGGPRAAPLGDVDRQLKAWVPAAVQGFERQLTRRDSIESLNGRVGSTLRIEHRILKRQAHVGRADLGLDRSRPRIRPSSGSGSAGG